MTHQEYSSMVNLVKFFAILRSTGESLVTASIDDTIDENLIGGFLTALYSFGFSSLNEQLSKFSLESSNMRLDSLTVDFDSEVTLIAVAFLSQEVSHEDFIYFTNRILMKFHDDNYNPLREWDGELTKFEYFNLYLKREIADTFGKGEEGFDDKLDDIFQRMLDGDMDGVNDL